jgi:hypothetical protein
MVLRTSFQLSLTSPTEYARGTYAHIHFALETSDAQALDLLSTPGACKLTLTRHQVNYIHVKTGQRSQSGVKDVVANGRVWPAKGEPGVNAEAGVESEMRSKAFWGEIPISQDFRAGFTIPSISLHVRGPIPASTNVEYAIATNSRG